MVTLILLALLTAGTAGLITVYLFSNSSKQPEPAPLASLQQKLSVSRKIQTVKAPNPDPASPDELQKTIETLSGQSEEKQTSALSREVATEKPGAPHTIKGKPRPAPKVTALTKENLDVDPAKSTSSATPYTDILHEPIEETSKANGTFYSAQLVNQGKITGSRGSEGDLADYFKVKVESDFMDLNIIGSDGQASHKFLLNVFDSNLRSVRANKGETVSDIRVSVERGKTYYIKVDLSQAPVKYPTYTLNIRFSP